MICASAWPLALTITLLAGCLGCGGGPSGGQDLSSPPSSLTICRATCTWNKSCVPALYTPNCESVCDGMADRLLSQDTQNDQQCKNYPEIRRQTLYCLGLAPCAQSQACLNTIDHSCKP